MSTPEIHEIDGVGYAFHRKEGKPDSVRIKYFSGPYLEWVEWCCPTHGGYASTRAAYWWSTRSGKIPAPATAEEFLLRRKELNEPISIIIHKVNGYERIAVNTWLEGERPIPF